MRDPRIMSLFVGAVLVCSSVARAQLRQPEAKWVEPAPGCKFLDRFPVPNTVYTWTGSCVDGYVSGDGTLQMSGVMQWRFNGEFKEGRLISGTVTFPLGEYTGTLKDNLAEGPGVFRYTNGNVIEGTYEEGSVKGTATLTYADGSKYVGPLSYQNEPEGKGRLTYPSGSVYEGDFVAGNEQGQGTLTFADGGSYHVAFLAGTFSGKGDMHYADGGTYVGEFRAGKRQGHGTLHFPNDDEYVGDFIADRRHGVGRLVQANGNVLEGEWKNDQLNGKCQVTVAQDLQYSGSCVAGQFHGNGHLQARGFSYDGEFARGVTEGKGTLQVTADDGTAQATLEGEFRAGVLYKGTITSKSGRKFELDNERQTVFEILPDGSKQPISQIDLQNLIVQEPGPRRS